MIKAVIFDMGGVLTYDVWEHLLLDNPNKEDKLEGIASKYCLGENLVEEIGKELLNKFAYTLKPTREGEYNSWSEKEYWEEFIQRTGVNATVNDFIEMTDKFIRPIKDFESMERILESLKKSGTDLAILSNNTEFWAKRQIEKLNLYRFFSESKVILSCRIGAQKTDSKMFKTVLDALGCVPEECIFVDDRPHNVKAAKRLGMIGVQFKGSKKLIDQLRSIGIDVHIRWPERQLRLLTAGL